MERLGRRVVWLLDEVVDFVVIVLLLSLFLLGAYSLWDTNAVYGKADAANYAAFKPSRVATTPSFQDLQTMNPDVFGWLDIYGTHIDYPLVQGSSNEEYLSIDPTGAYSLSGSLFLDSASARDFSDFSSIIYGHHMEKQAMFGEIGGFTDETFFQDHRYGSLYYGGVEHGLEFFAVLQVDAYSCDLYQVPVGTDRARAYLDEIETTALHARDIGVGTGDHIVLLSTCSDSSTNGRTILVGRIMDEVPEDTFATTDEVNAGTGLQRLEDGLGGIRPLALILVLLLVLLIIMLVVLLIRSRRRGRPDEAEEEERKGGGYGRSR